MNYKECKQSLYNSVVMEEIPDCWKQEAPIIFYENGEKKLGFLFSIVKNGKTKIKKMISVSLIDGKVKEYTPEKLKQKYQVTDQFVQAMDIQDYDEYFIQKNEQEKILADIVDGKDVEVEHYIKLTRVLFSEEQYKKILSRIENIFTINEK